MPEQTQSGASVPPNASVPAIPPPTPQVSQPQPAAPVLSHESYVYKSHTSLGRRLVQFLVTTAVAVVLSVGVYALMSGRLDIGSFTKKPAEQKNQPKTTTSLAGSSADRTLIAYRPLANSVANANTYTLARPDGSIVKQEKSTEKWQLASPLGNNAYLFYDISTSKAHYATFDTGGFHLLVNMPGAFDLRLKDGISPTRTVTDFGTSLVAYQTCSGKPQAGMSADGHQCSVRTLGLTDGADTIVATPGNVTDNRSTLAGISLDRKYAYYYGIAPTYRKQLEQDARQLGLDIATGTAPQGQPVSELRYTLTVLKVSLQNQTVADQRLASVAYTTNPLWLSPNGDHLLYQKKAGDASLQYVYLPTGEASTITLPGTDAASKQPVSLYGTPYFSPDGSKLAYAAAEKDTGREVFGVIDLPARTARTYQVESSPANPAAPFFDNILWLSPTQLAYTAAVTNNMLNLNDGTAAKLTDAHGTLIGYPVVPPSTIKP